MNSAVAALFSEDETLNIEYSHYDLEPMITGKLSKKVIPSTTISMLKSKMKRGS